MVNILCTSWWVIGSWSAAVVAILLASDAMHANASTTVLLGALAIAQAIMAMSFGDGTSASPTVAQALHPDQTKAGRS